MPGLGRKVFTAGDVLTASDVQNYLMDQTVMNFAGTAARSSAIATPTTGMTTYIGTTGTASIPQLEIYTGSAFQTPYGSTLIGRGTFSGAATFSMDNVFSATYDNYIIQISNAVPATFGNLALRMRVSGADNSSSNYTQGRIFVGSVGSAAQSSTNNSTSAEFIIVQMPTTLDNSQATVTLTNPFTALRTGYTSLGSGNLLDISGGNMTVTTSYTGFTLLNAAGGNIAGTVRVYGLRNS